MTYERTFRGKDGRAYTIRPLTPEDAERMMAFLAALSPETRYRRFHILMPDPPREDVLRRVGEHVAIPPARGVALVALDDDTIVGSARCQRAHPEDTAAEAAVVVRDDYQGRGIGKHLLLALVEEARARGVRVLYAYIQPDNKRILEMLARAHLPVRTSFEAGAMRVEVLIGPETSHWQQVKRLEM